MEDLTSVFARIQQRIDAANFENGVAIHHIESETTFEWQAETPFVAASVIKVPIMAAVYQQVAIGAFSLCDAVTVRDEDMVTGSGLLQNLTPGVTLSVRDLVVLMIIDSDNTATNILIEKVGLKNIQAAMETWGLTRSRIFNKLQVIPVHREGINTITARDMMTLMAKMARGQIVSWDACRRMIEILKQQRYNDSLPSLLPQSSGPIGAIPSWQLAHKTGFVDDLDHDVGLLYLPGHTFAVAVLSRGDEDRSQARYLKGEIGRVLFDAVVTSGV